MNKINNILELGPEIKLIISLGNPGEKYENTRHNAGHVLLDILLKKKIISKDKYKIYKSIDFMNNSGVFVSQKLHYYKLKPENLLILHDDLDINIGGFKLQFAKGPKVHNGILSIEQHLKSDQFWRLRIGIENRPAERLEKGRNFVLNNFNAEEKKILAELF